MALVLSEEQEILRRTAREFVSVRSSLKRVRALRDDRAGEGFDAALWAEMAGLGWLGIVVPEEYGGLGLGFTEQMVVLEELGRGLVPEPIVGTVLLGAMTVLLGGDEAQKQAILPAVAAGERFLALAYQEPGSRYDATRVATRAERAGSGWRLTGDKLGVLDGQAAEHFIVSARTDGQDDDAADGGITLFVVRRDAPGVTVEPQHRIDGRGSARVVLESVTVSSDGLLGAEGAATAVLERVLDRATIALTAEMLGSMCVAFETTLEYLKTREQFGKPIGSFQALKHRAARLFIETELARSIVMEAHAAIDRGADDGEVARLASAAKARCSDAFMLVANEAVQMHGGIGMTDEHDIGLFLKRARAAEIQFGDAAHHRDRVATLDGY
jgi:alkylation response protein AidB-like acyl-CoA dehydrogenase